MTKYSKGARFENEVKDILVEDDWLVVRAAGSHGIIDVLAVKYGVIWGIQCREGGYITPDERKEIIALARKHKATPIVASKQKGDYVFEEVKPKEPEFTYEVVNGKFTKVEKQDAE